MRILSSVGVVVLALLACRSEAPRPENSSPAPGEVVFDGRTLAGWDGDTRFWSVADGCIVGRSTPENPCSDSTYLIWRGGEVGDFELEFEYRITGGNSGMQFRSRETAQWKVAGFQADIEDGPNWSGCLYEQDGRGVVARRGEMVQLEPTRKIAATSGAPGELEQLAKPREWNRYRVRAVGPLVELALNGATTVRVLDLDPAQFRPSGLLALQLHAGGPMTIEVRNLRLERLEAPSEPPAPFFETAPAAASPSSGEKPPQWLWSSPNPRDGECVAFRRELHASSAPERFIVRATADNHLRVFVNGELVLSSDEWWRPREVDVTGLVREGANEVLVLAKNDGGPAAMWVEALVDGESGRMLRVISDSAWSTHTVAPDSYDSWKPTDFEPARAGAPHVIGPVGIEPWHSMGAAMRGESAPAAASGDESALPASELKLLDGFGSELLYSVPRAEQGSWVSLCEDPRGRFYVSDQYGPLFRVTAPPIGSSDETRVERVPIELGMAQGLCWAYDSLYAVVAEGSQRSPGLYRCRDTDGDDQLDDVQLLRAFEGGGEHGPHGVVLGPDGHLWITGGNHTKLPEPIDVYRLPRTWGEDALLPTIPDPNGHAVGVMAPGGWVVRTDENGKRWELWAAGFRNAYDIAFDRDGELFTFDSDMEWDVGLPWYRPARVCHVVSGAEFGWRNGSGKWPADYPDTLPSVCDIGLASPTGVVFGTNAAFPARYRDAFFALDWAYGTIFAVHLEPKGASYTGTFEKFATGKPFPVTDVVIGRDGAMYVTTGGRRTQSGLYRIAWTRELETESELTKNVNEWKQDRVSANRKDREFIELHHDVDTSQWDDAQIANYSHLIAPHVRPADHFVARAAMVALERARPSSWLPWNHSAGAPGARLAIAALHVDPAGQRDEVLLRLLDPMDWRSSESETIDWLRTLGLLMIRSGPLDGAWRVTLRDRVEQLAQRFGANPRVDREVLQMLVALDSPLAVEPGVAILESAAPQEERIWAAYCLRCAREGWTSELRERFFRALAKLRATAVGGHSLAKYLDVIRTQSLDAVPESERERLAAIGAPSAAAVANAPAAKFVHAWTKEELAPLVREALRGRDFERGRVAYAKARCNECHRLGGDGGSTGPDLTGAGSRFSRSDLVDAIVTPSATISDQYQDTEFVTADGDLYVGRFEGESDGFARLRRTPPDDDLIELALEEIASRRPHPLSRMPSGLIDVLERDEVLDLLAYVLAGGAADDPAFR